MSNVNVYAVDLSKNLFHLVGLNAWGGVMSRQKLNRSKFCQFLVQLKGCKLFMEACGSAHYWCRLAKMYGVEAIQLSPHHVKPFVGTQKNDYRDAKAIGEVGIRGTRWTVPTKAAEQQEMEFVHQIRSRQMSNRVAVINQIRGFLYEFGVVLPQGTKAVYNYYTNKLDEEGRLSTRLKADIRDLYQELFSFDEKIAEAEEKIKQRSKEQESIKRLMTISGIGLLTASALWALSGDPHQFKNGRSFAANLGVVPRQNTTGGKERLGRITKCGDKYVRKLLISGAHSVVRNTVGREERVDKTSLWIKDLQASKGNKLTAVALANKNARIAWKLLTSEQEYRKEETAKQPLV